MYRVGYSLSGKRDSLPLPLFLIANSESESHPGLYSKQATKRNKRNIYLEKNLGLHYLREALIQNRPLRKEKKPCVRRWSRWEKNEVTFLGGKMAGFLEGTYTVHFMQQIISRSYGKRDNTAFKWNSVGWLRKERFASSCFLI